MAAITGIKISALPAASASTLTDIIPAAQTGVTKRETLQQVLTLFNSNIQIGSSTQVTGLNAQLATFLLLSGGTMAGPLILSTNSPTMTLEAASKGYVDTVASGFTVILACLLASTANLTATYVNGAAGVGATLTNSGAFAIFAVDGVSPAVGSRILVKNQMATLQNGIYTVTTVGDAVSVNWVITRATDYDQAAEIQPGTLVAVNSGTVNATTSWLETATVTAVGTDPILFSQFTFAPSAFLQVANNLSDVASASTSRTNLGLGTVATKAASDVSKTNAVMLDAASTIGNIAIFTDVNGTIGDGGIPSSSMLNNLADGRLTLTSSVPVTTSDVLAATIVYYTPYIGNSIALYDGSTNWDTITFTQLSIAVPGTTNTIYDFFVYNNSGTATPELQAWTNDTARAVGLVRQNGVLVKAGSTTRRYVGSFRTTTVAGQTEDSLAKRYVWNYYNRVSRPMVVFDTTNSWTYTVAAFRQSNNNSANRLDCVVGVAEDAIQITASSVASNISAGILMSTGIGVNSTTVNSAPIRYGSGIIAGGATFSVTANYNSIPAAGRTFYPWLEYSQVSGTTTWYGDQGGAFMQTGINGTVIG